MFRNVEVKARVRDLPAISKRAAELSGSAGEQLTQSDTFYAARFGRLKLRHQTPFPVSGGAASLVYYDRPDDDGPKLSQYDICHFSVADAVTMHTILEKSLGIKGVLKKHRYLYMVGQTRVHIDVVEGLGNFMELEVVLRPDQSLEEGQQIARDLQQKLGVQYEDLLSGAYMDLVLNKDNKH